MEKAAGKMTTFGLGFSQQEVNRKCRTVLYRDRYKNSKFKSLGNNVMRRMKVVRSMENMDLDQDTSETGAKAVTIIIGGRGVQSVYQLSAYKHL